MKHRVYNIVSSEKDSVPQEDMQNTSSLAIEDPYLAEIGSIIAQSQDSRILTKEDYQHLLKLKEESKKNGHK